MEGGRITEQAENKLELQILPYCYIAWMPRDEEGLYPAKITTEVPVYFGLTRETLLCQFTLPQIGNATDKIISGVAIFIQGSD